MAKERVIITLACTQCKNRNYHFARAKRADKKLGIKKFCKACKKHTPHKEVK